MYPSSNEVTGIKGAAPIKFDYGKFVRNERKMIRSTIKLSVSQERRQDVLGLLRPLVDSTQSLAGCTECILCVDVKDESQLCFNTEWNNTFDLQHYMRSDEFRAILAAMDLCRQKPEVSFQEICETFGMEYIDAVRSSNVSVAKNIFSISSMKAR
jgi:quinol monooxygenase YgiN